jgi:hypothetical protein
MAGEAGEAEEGGERRVMLAESRDRSGRSWVLCEAGKHRLAERVAGVYVVRHRGRVVVFRDLISVECEECEKETLPNGSK